MVRFLFLGLPSAKFSAHATTGARTHAPVTGLTWVSKRSRICARVLPIYLPATGASLFHVFCLGMVLLLHLALGWLGIGFLRPRIWTTPANTFDHFGRSHCVSLSLSLSLCSCVSLFVSLFLFVSAPPCLFVPVSVSVCICLPLTSAMSSSRCVAV